jgi:hypothetical protein
LAPEVDGQKVTWPQALAETASRMHSRELVSMFAAPINPFISLLAA